MRRARNQAAGLRQIAFPEGRRQSFGEVILLARFGVTNLDW
jgi:hypothetical protein